LAYIVKDTFEYIGDEQFNTLGEFLQWFWKDSFEDYLLMVSAKSDIEDGPNKVLPLRDSIISQSWDPETKVYTRIVDFDSPVKYLENRMVHQGLLWGLDSDLSNIFDANEDLIKTTEIIG
jgi:hypothetical protein